MDGMLIQRLMEDIILVGDDLMLGPPSPLIPPEIASHVLEVDLCDGILRNLFLCLQVHGVEPFVSKRLAYIRSVQSKAIRNSRQRLQDSENKLGLSMPINEAKERASQLESEATNLEGSLILASGVEGMEGFQQRWSLHGRITHTKSRLEALKQGIEMRKKDDQVASPATKRWIFW